MESNETTIYRDPLKNHIVYMLRKNAEGQWQISKRIGRGKWRKNRGPWKQETQAREELAAFVWSNGLIREVYDDDRFAHGYD